MYDAWGVPIDGREHTVMKCGSCHQQPLSFVCLMHSLCVYLCGVCVCMCVCVLASAPVCYVSAHTHLSVQGT